ncbi:MAG: isoleucine--tRNA ligase, partial [Bacteroidales bacterium]|nr:isoleucine--tRNA ligase [Bacteroidales bacterium]
EIAQTVSSMVLGLRRKVNIKVRQPLQKIMVPLIDKEFREKVEAVKNLILSEVNVKEVEYLSDASDILVKKIKPNFKALGPKYGKLMKDISTALGKLSQKDILKFETEENINLTLGGETLLIGMEDAEVVSEDIPGWLVANEGKLTVALDITITDELRFEGIAREFINRIQNLRKESGYEVTDKISIEIEKHEAVNEAVEKHREYIGSQTLAHNIRLVDKLNADSREVEIDEKIRTRMKISRLT